jgi:hypothetical protein
MSNQLQDLIDAARQVEITPEMARQQRQSFVFGNVSIHNPAVTRELVAQADAKLEGDKATNASKL